MNRIGKKDMNTACDARAIPTELFMGKGKKSAIWDRVRASLKLQFSEWGIQSCEVCGGTFALSFAHRLKRRLITDDAEMRMVALLCHKHHEELEFSGHDNMFQKITDIIEKRDIQCYET